MAITKIGQEVLEKESSLVSLLGIPAAVHVAQNLATKKALKSPKFHRRLLETFSNNFKNGKDSVSTTGQIGFGAAKGAVPELAILDNEAGHVANHLREFLKKKNISGDLSKRDLVAVRNLLRGDFTKAMKRSPEVTGELLEQLIQKTVGGSAEANSVLGAVKKNKHLVTDLEQLWKQNKLTGGMLRGVADQMG